MKSKWAAKRNKKLKHLQETLVDHTILITTETSTSNSKYISKSEKTVSVLNRNQQEKSTISQ